MAQNWYLGVLKPAEHEFGNEKFLRCRIEGLQVDFQKKFNFACCNKLFFIIFDFDANESEILQILTIIIKNQIAIGISIPKV